MLPKIKNRYIGGVLAPLLLSVFLKYVLTLYVFCAIIIMQGGKQNANETKGDGKVNPCGWMDV